MQQLHVANELLGNRQALKEAWERDGYWFFKQVIDLDAVARLRNVYLAKLEQHGLINPNDATARYTGADIDKFGNRAGSLDLLGRSDDWQLLIKDPKVQAFFKTLLGEDAYWIPIVEYRAVAPAKDRTGNRLIYVHQDSFYNPGVPFRICWFPLVPIDEDVGGMIIAEGLHRGPTVHDVNNPPSFQVPEGAIPDSAWRRAHYQPGDVLIMDLSTPHTGVTNHSERFRLSLDIRMMPVSENPPAIGPITAIDESSITVRDLDGRERTYRMNADTYCRGPMTEKVTPLQMSQQVHIGDEMIVAGTDGVASLVRPQH